MNFLTFLRIFIGFFLKGEKKIKKYHQPKISILIPFSSNDPSRIANFKWLLEYWKKELPRAEIIVGHSQGKIFCKAEALNNAARKATGKVFIILDADAYISGKILNRCADRILQEKHNHLWYVPYRSLYRLTENVSRIIVDSPIDAPFRLPSPPLPHQVTNGGHKTKYGHRYGAMCMMFPREAYETLGCFDERFKGWGGEDVALLRALDTLYGKHKTTNNDIYHLWHPFIGDTYQTRKWEGQENPNANGNLANRYNVATRRPTKMRELVDEGCLSCHLKDVLNIEKKNLEN